MTAINAEIGNNVFLTQPELAFYLVWIRIEKHIQKHVVILALMAVKDTLVARPRLGSHVRYISLVWQRSPDHPG